MTFNERPYQIVVHYNTPECRTAQEQIGYFSTPCDENAQLDATEYLALVQQRYPEGKFSIMYYDEFPATRAQAKLYLNNRKEIK